MNSMKGMCNVYSGSTLACAIVLSTIHAGGVEQQ
jgi:hypothetical protein